MLPFIVLMVLASSTTAQRSPYQPNRSFPGLLPRFQTEDQAGLGNRAGIPESPPIATELQGTLHEDKHVQRVAEWPEDRQPFWFKNRQVVKDQIRRPVDGNGPNNWDSSQGPSNWGSQVTNQRPVNWGNQNNNPGPNNWGNPNQAPANGGRRPTQGGIINSGQRSGTVQQTGDDYGQDYENFK